MRRIKIDHILESKVNKFCDDLFITTRANTFTHPLILLEKLYWSLRANKQMRERAYLRKLIEEYNSILKIKPSEFPSKIDEFNKLLPSHHITKEFHESVVKAMRYADLRKKEFVNFLKDEEIKSCVYCNAQLTVVIDLNFYSRKKQKKIKTRKATLELDHFYPKSKYPFLCTSFYNLYPSCGTCNKSKHSNKSYFQLYTENDDVEVFKFSLSKASELQYRIDFDKNGLEINFDSVENDKRLLENHEELFGISGIYETQKDIAEELLHKSIAYSKLYKQGLKTNFKFLFPDISMMNRLIIGNYDKPDDVHKRPLAKFTQDIAEQVGLLK